MKMNKTYNPEEFEEKLYKFWNDNGFFTAKVDKNKIPFSMVIPPPNVTGQLHMGHAFNNAIQDTIARFKRMQGYSVLWLPGVDHASIATEVKVVEKMKKEEGLTKQDVGRDGFMERAWAWKNQFGGRIVEQLKRLGSSLDWTREAFTMDEKCNKAVRHVFVNLYNKGLIYKGDRIINWCPSCKTALSDAEVEYEEKDSFLWHIRYPYADGSGEIVIATTRPETLLGDTAVAVNPKDERYRDQIGKMLILPIVNKEIPLIGDDYVEIGFGSGAVKITPAHDPNDFEVGERHNLEVIKVIGDDGVMNENAMHYAGMTREECREKIVEELKDKGYLVKIEPYKHNVGQCYRCRSVVEPMVSKQWFVHMEPLAKPAIDVVRKKKVEFIPDRFTKIYYNWMENIKDWCISRQLWWGHRIPAYYCDKCGEMVVAEDMPSVCPKCGCTHFHQDEDVLDTWFSSALWPFSTLGYPDKTKDLEYFYPTSLLVTAYDIIFFWVARMIFSGVEHMGEIPFPEVLIHGIVRDAQGRKMSKSLGNGIDPLELIDKYGADSLRFSLLMGVAPGGDIRYSAKKTEDMSTFMNKIWNASRFVLMNLGKNSVKEMGTFRYTPADKWILSRLNTVIKEVTQNLSKYELGLAATKLYNFVWSEFCDWYIELAKPYLYGDNENKKSNTLSVIVYVMKTILKLLHPFIPFITEEIYQNFPHKEKSIMIAQWPTANKSMAYKKEGEYFTKVMDMITAIRNVRAEMNVAPSKPIRVMTTIDAKDLDKVEIYLRKLANVTEIEYIADKSNVGNKVTSIVTPLGELIIPLGDLVDTDKEIERLEAEIEKMNKEIARGERMLSNEGFLAKAPHALVENETKKLKGYKDKKAMLLDQLALIKD